MPAKPTINLDANATYGIDGGLMEHLKSVLPGCLNASSVHSGGQRSRALIEAAREDVCALIDGGEARIIFTSGATESNNAIINSLISTKDDGLVVSAVEHPSILEAAVRAQENGAQVSFVKPRKGGEFHAEDFLQCCNEQTKAVSCMLANNETGNFLPVDQISAAIRGSFGNIHVHSDVVQILGKSTFSFSASKIDSISVSAHKIGGLAGCGALVIKDDRFHRRFICGGPQETHFRAGTENLAGIVSFGYAARKLKRELSENILKMSKLRDLILAKLMSGIEDLVVNSNLQNCLPNTVNIRIPGIKSDDLVVALDLQGIYVSSGAACASGKPEPSHVLMVSGLTEAEARSSVRISVNCEIPLSEASYAAEAIVKCVQNMRASAALKPSQMEIYA